MPLVQSSAGPETWKLARRGQKPALLSLVPGWDSSDVALLMIGRCIIDSTLKYPASPVQISIMSLVARRVLIAVAFSCIILAYVCICCSCARRRFF
jgi:hypothetical protein